MDKFISCVCDNKLSVLIQSGKPPINVVQDAWVNLKSEYLQALNDGRSNAQIELMQEVTEFDWRRTEVESLIQLLETGYDEQIVTILWETYEFDYPLTELSYISDIAKIRAELASEALGVDMVRVQVYGDGKQANNVTKQTYYNTILLLQKKLGLCQGLTPMLVCKQLTVFEYATYVNEYNNSIVTKTEPYDDGEE